MVERLRYIIPFAIIYLLFSLIMIRIARSRTQIVFGGYYNENSNKSFKELFIIFVAILISAIKMNFGSDYWSYYMIYNKSITWYSSVPDIINNRGHILGSGIYVVSFLIKSFTHSIGWDTTLENNLLFIVVSIFTSCVTFKQIKRNSCSFEWSVAAYFLLGYFMIANNILKQQVAMSFILIAYGYFEEKKYFRYMIFCAIACFFHSTALVIAILIPIVRLVKLDNRVVKIFGVICVGAMALLPYTIKYFSAFTSLFSEKYIDNFSAYAASNVGRTYVVCTLIMYIFLFSFGYKNREKIPDEYKQKNSFYLSLIAVGIFVNIISINFWLAIRISLYFYQFAIFMVPNYIEASEMSYESKKNILMLMCIFCVLYVCFSWDNHYFSYHTIWSGMKPLYLYDYIAQYE